MRPAGRLLLLARFYIYIILSFISGRLRTRTWIFGFSVRPIKIFNYQSCVIIFMHPLPSAKQLWRSCYFSAGRENRTPNQLIKYNNFYSVCKPIKIKNFLIFSFIKSFPVVLLISFHSIR